MPGPPCQRVVTLSEGLFQPLHNSRKLQPVFGLDEKANPVSLNAETPNLKGEADHGFLENPEKESGGPGLVEKGLPVVDAGARFIPDILGKFTCLSHIPVMGARQCFALVEMHKFEAVPKLQFLEQLP
jgi:hypothetical protein